MTSVLIVDDDPDITEFMQINLELDGFEVRVAGDGEEALRVMNGPLPDLVLVDVMMPKVDGMELCRRLRANPRTANLPIIMVTAKTLPADKVVGLTVGADDYISKPFDTVELTARVRTTLRRNAEMRAVSPLTGLPGNHRIDAEIAARVATERAFAVCHLDLDHFKAFNDCYGFLRGDEVISAVAAALRQAAAEVAGPACFIGHIGGDDFVLVCERDQAESVCRRVIDIVDAALPALHDSDDVA
ncbi:MAG: response regulator, partial [Mycobacteriales bacterium]